MEVVGKTVHVIGHGAYDIEGKSYPYVILTDGNGDGLKFMLPKAADHTNDRPTFVDAPADFSVIVADVEFAADGNKTKKKLLCWKDAGPVAKAA